MIRQNKRTLSPHLHQPVEVSLPLQFRPRTACSPTTIFTPSSTHPFSPSLSSSPQAFLTPHCQNTSSFFLFSLCIHVQRSHKKTFIHNVFRPPSRHISMSFPGVLWSQCCRSAFSAASTLIFADSQTLSSPPPLSHSTHRRRCQNPAFRSQLFSFFRKLVPAETTFFFLFYQ